MPQNSWILLDDRQLTANERHDLDSFLKRQAEVIKLGAFIPHLEASAATLIAKVTGVLTTVTLRIPKPVKDGAAEILKSLIVEWLKSKHLPEGKEDPNSYVTIYDQYDHPCVRVQLPAIPKRKSNQGRT